MLEKTEIEALAGSVELPYPLLVGSPAELEDGGIEAVSGAEKDPVPEPATLEEVAG